MVLLREILLCSYLLIESSLLLLPFELCFVSNKSNTIAGYLLANSILKLVSRHTDFNLEFTSPKWIAGQCQLLHQPFLRFCLETYKLIGELSTKTMRSSPAQLASKLLDEWLLLVLLLTEIDHIELSRLFKGLQLQLPVRPTSTASPLVYRHRTFVMCS